MRAGEGRRGTCGCVLLAVRLVCRALAKLLPVGACALCRPCPCASLFLHPSYVRLLHHPIAAVFSRCLSDFYSPAHSSIDRVPEVVGRKFSELHFRFPGAPQ